MLTKNENIFIILIWLILFGLYYSSLNDNLNVHESLVISFISMATIKSLYDIKNRTGNKRMYVYSESTNQKLRYLAFVVILGVCILAHYFMFCSKLQFCG